jgi:hypothetical protein
MTAPPARRQAGEDVPSVHSAWFPNCRVCARRQLVCLSVCPRMLCGVQC